MSNGSSELIRYYQICRAILKAAEPVENLLDDYIIHYRLTRLDNPPAVRGNHIDSAIVEAVREMDRQVDAIRSRSYRKLIRGSLNRISHFVFPDTNRAMPWYILNPLSAEMLLTVTDYTVKDFDRLDGALRELKNGIHSLRQHVVNLQAVPEIRDVLLAEARNGTPVDADCSIPAAVAETPPEQAPRKGMAERVLSDRQYLALQTLLEQQAFTPDKRCKRQVIATKAEGQYATASTYGKHIANLVLRGLAVSQRGPNGGIWLTQDGRELAERLAENRKP